MPFVNERIPDADRERAELQNIRHPWGHIIHFSWWTVDRPNDCFLVNIRGSDKDDREKEIFIFKCNGAVSRLVMRRKASRSESGDVYEYSIVGGIPQHAGVVFFNKLREALIEFGGFYGVGKVSSITFDF